MSDVTTVANLGTVATKESVRAIPKTARVIRLFLLFEVATYVAATLAHFGIFVSGYEHRAAGTAESVIAAVLLAGLAATWVGPLFTREIGLAAQMFALLGTLVGLFTIVIGVGPRTVPDIAYHVSIVAVLVWGLVVAKRTPSGARPSV
jgi:hypothetical protein